MSLCFAPAGLTRKNAPGVFVVIPNERRVTKSGVFSGAILRAGAIFVRRFPATHPFGASAKMRSRRIFPPSGVIIRLCRVTTPRSLCLAGQKIVPAESIGLGLTGPRAETLRTDRGKKILKL